jgi:hypothetical protein
MAKAIEAVKTKDVTFKKAAEMFRVPRSTLHDHVKKGYNPGTKRGKKPVLSKFLEKELYDLATRRTELGLSRVDFLEMAGELAAEHSTPFKNGRPSESWLIKMMKRCGGTGFTGLQTDSQPIPKLRIKLQTKTNASKKKSKKSQAEQSDHPYSVPFYTTEVEVDTSQKNRPDSDLIRSQISNRVKSALEEHLTRDEPISEEDLMEPMPSRIEQLADLAESMSQELAAQRAQIERERNAQIEREDETKTSRPKSNTDSIDEIVKGIVDGKDDGDNDVVPDESVIVDIKPDPNIGDLVHREPGQENVCAEVEYEIELSQVKTEIELVPAAASAYNIQETSGRPCAVTIVQPTEQTRGVALPPVEKQAALEDRNTKRAPLQQVPVGDYYIVCETDQNSVAQKIQIDEVLKLLAQDSDQNIQISHVTGPPTPSEPMQYVELKDIAGIPPEGMQFVQVLAQNDQVSVVQETETIQEGVPEEYLLKTESASEEVHHLIVDSSVVLLTL